MGADDLLPVECHIPPMREPVSFRHAFPRDSRSILRLTRPLIVNNIVIAGMTLANTLFAGRLGLEPRAGVAVGGSYYQMFWLFGLGVLMSISPIVAHAYGGGRDEEVGRRFRQGVWLALIGTIPLGIGILALSTQLERLGIDSHAANLTRDYLGARLWGLLPFLLFAALRSYLQSVGRATPMFYAALIANLINLRVNVVIEP